MSRVPQPRGQEKTAKNWVFRKFSENISIATSPIFRTTHFWWQPWPGKSGRHDRRRGQRRSGAEPRGYWRSFFFWNFFGISGIFLKISRIILIFLKFLRSNFKTLFLISEIFEIFWNLIEISWNFKKKTRNFLKMICENFKKFRKENEKC